MGFFFFFFFNIQTKILGKQCARMWKTACYILHFFICMAILFVFTIFHLRDRQTDTFWRLAELEQSWRCHWSMPNALCVSTHALGCIDSFLRPCWGEVIPKTSQSQHEKITWFPALILHAKCEGWQVGNPVWDGFGIKNNIKYFEEFCIIKCYNW